eukprot:TRINITY_DN23020_c0_g1_i1.p1 TRINITY_DN23020_c0_g1~~TRINITY_DN23020_c0_g1_i1.p1  ORF type:complete len:686 (+),score=125.49 TRINITY_DN23020_c0_g1_i1:152-2209(+)
MNVSAANVKQQPANPSNVKQAPASPHSLSERSAVDISGPVVSLPRSLGASKKSLGSKNIKSSAAAGITPASSPSHASKVSAVSKTAPIKAAVGVKSLPRPGVKSMPIKGVTSPSLLQTSEHQLKRDAIKLMAVQQGRRMSAHRQSSNSTTSRTDPVPRYLSMSGPSPLALPTSQGSVPAPSPSYEVAKDTVRKVREAIVSKHGTLAAWSSDLNIDVRSNDHVLPKQTFRNSLIGLGVGDAVADGMVRAVAIDEKDVSVSKFFKIATEGFHESVVKVKHVTVQACSGVRAIVAISPSDGEEKTLMATASRLGVRNPYSVQVVNGSGGRVSLTYHTVTDGEVYFFKNVKQDTEAVEASTSTATLPAPKETLYADCATSTASLKPQLFETGAASPPQKRQVQTPVEQTKVDLAQVHTQTDVPSSDKQTVAASDEERGVHLGYDSSSNSTEPTIQVARPPLTKKSLLTSQVPTYKEERLIRAEREVSNVPPTPAMTKPRFAMPTREEPVMLPQPMPMLRTPRAGDLSLPFDHVVHQSTSPGVSDHFGAAFGEQLRSERLRRGLPFEESNSLFSGRLLAPAAPAIATPAPHVAWSPQRVVPYASKAPLITASYQTYEIRVTRVNLSLPVGIHVVGVVVEGVASRSPAELAGIKPGMMLHAIDGHPVASYDSIQERLKAASASIIFLISVP